MKKLALVALLAVSAFGQVKKAPVLKEISTGPFAVVPQLLDGTQYRTIVYIQNFGTKAESFRLNLMNEDGTPASYHFAETGGTTGSLSGTLQPLALAVYHTNGGPAAPYQIGWAQMDYSNTGQDVGVWVVIESADPITGNWTTQSLVNDYPSYVTASDMPKILFDQTDGFVCGVAIVNTSSYAVENFTLEALDATGVVVDSAPLTIQPQHHYQFVLSALLPKSVGIAGTVRLKVVNADDLLPISIIGIKATAYKTGWTQTSLPVKWY